MELRCGAQGIEVAGAEAERKADVGDGACVGGVEVEVEAVRKGDLCLCGTGLADADDHAEVEAFRGEVADFDGLDVDLCPGDDLVHRLLCEVEREDTAPV
ncbi:hypothetical protein L1887_51863 [Cichorium endivia]|nr:hypothetical protein L1887_51863 [Cichorium endivia]